MPRIWAMKTPTPIPRLALLARDRGPCGQHGERGVRVTSYRVRVLDDLTARYGDLLTGSYDCVDRIVLNAYFSLGHGPGGFRTWWRRWHDDRDEGLDNAHLMRMAGRVSRPVRA